MRSQLKKNFAALRKKATRSLMSPSSLPIMTREGAEGSPGSAGVSGQKVWPPKGVVRIHSNHPYLSKAFYARDSCALLADSFCPYYPHCKDGKTEAQELGSGPRRPAPGSNDSSVYTEMLPVYMYSGF